MSGQAGVGACGIAAPYAGQRKGHHLGPGLGLEQGRADEQAALGHFAAHTIVVERKYTVNKLSDATRSEPRDLIWLY
jgi:hypothetical protein